MADVCLNQQRCGREEDNKQRGNRNERDGGGSSFYASRTIPVTILEEIRLGLLR